MMLTLQQIYDFLAARPDEVFNIEYTLACPAALCATHLSGQEHQADMYSTWFTQLHSPVFTHFDARWGQWLEDHLPSAPNRKVLWTGRELATEIKTLMEK